jgi:hypothetical protein
MQLTRLVSVSVMMLFFVLNQNFPLQQTRGRQDHIPGKKLYDNE